MIRALEERYRRLLGWYPRSWRTKNSDVMVGTFLDVAEADGRTYPTFRERGSVIVRGLTARMDHVIAPEVRNASSTISLTVGTGIALAEFVMSSWAPWVTGAPAPGVIERSGGFFDTGFLFAAFWIIALIAAVTRNWGVGRASLIASILLGLLPQQLLQTSFGTLTVDRTTLAMLSTSALLAVLGRPRPGPITVGAATGWGLLAVCAYRSSNSPEGWLPSESLWSQVFLFAYGALGLIIVASILAIARFWRVAFTIILSLIPLVLTFMAGSAGGLVQMRGLAIILGIPVAVGVILLVLHSSRRLTFPARTPLRRTGWLGPS